MEQSIVIRDTETSVVDVLDMISKGLGYEQILSKKPELTLVDIMASAQFAKELIEGCVRTDNAVLVIDGTITIKASNGRIINLTDLRKQFPRAYEKWDAREDNQLTDMFKHGSSPADIAASLKRQPGAIRSRLEKLGLINRK